LKARSSYKEGLRTVQAGAGKLFFAKKQALTQRKSAVTEIFEALHEQGSGWRLSWLPASKNRIPDSKMREPLANRTRYLNEYSDCIVHSTPSTAMRRSCGVFAHHFLFFSPERI